MKWLRRRLSWVLSSWLLCQVAALAMPLALVSGGMAAEICTCSGEDHGATCPMHHGKHQSSDDDRQCSMQNASKPLDAMLLSMAGGSGVLPLPVFFLTPQPSSERAAIVTIVPSSWSELPTSPPPRA